MSRTRTGPSKWFSTFAEMIGDGMFHLCYCSVDDDQSVSDERLPMDSPTYTWSGLEMEFSGSGTTATMSRDDSLTMSTASSVGSHQECDSSLLRNSREPTSRQSNIPVLRQLPSFGSTLTSRSASFNTISQMSTHDSYSTMEEATIPGEGDTATRQVNGTILPPSVSGRSKLPTGKTSPQRSHAVRSRRIEPSSFIFLEQ